MIRWIRKTYHPEIFQGNLRRKKYFEGWYFKLVSANSDKCAFIPGISLTEKDPHSFIQYIDGKSGRTTYTRFPLKVFEYSKKELLIKIGSNVFSNQKIILNIEQENFTARGEVVFSNLKKLPPKLFAPGIMGWYSFVPFMECYHGLVSMDHALTGILQIDGEPADFTSGKGFIEKDWGSSFPRSWIWMQSNNFTGKVTSFMFSVAKIPWLTGEFDGFLCVVLLGDKFLRFASYTGAKLVKLETKDKVVEIEIADRHYHLKATAERDHTGRLAAPVFGVMSRSIHESINSRIRIEILDKKSGSVMEDHGNHAGCEIVGEQTFQIGKADV